MNQGVAFCVGSKKLLRRCKGLEHCGKCSDFPCDLLNQFAYDKEQGDDGNRIEQCREWGVNA